MNTSLHRSLLALSAVLLVAALLGQAVPTAAAGGLPGAFGKVSPVNGAVNRGLLDPVKGLRVTLKWQAATNATGYKYCIDLTNDNACNNWHQLSATSVTVNVYPKRTYYWQVMAVNTSGSTYANDGATAYWHFSTANPYAFNKLGPANGAANLPTSVTLSWEASPNATSYGYCYDPVVDGNCDGGWHGVFGLTAEITGLMPGYRYEWQIRAQSLIGNTIANGGYWQFTTAAPVKTTLRSNGAQDGWVLESGESTGTGGSLNAVNSTVLVGDNAARQQYRAILSFATGSLPDAAVVTSVTLKVKKATQTATDPFGSLGYIPVDISSGPFGAAALEIGDFEAAASKNMALVITAAPAGGWYSASMGSGDLSYINKTGPTQFRLQFSLDDDNDNEADFIKFYSGNAATVADRPALIVEYVMP